MADALHFAPSGRVPNSALPVLVHRGALAPDAPAQAHEALFMRHGWTGAWRNGVYPFHHFHATAHEVLGICGGRATLRLGGEGGRDVAVAAGDVLVLPAGTGHRRVGASEGFGVVGAYPDGCAWDLIRADGATEDDLRRAVAAIAAVPVPARDPVTGDPMAGIWRRPS
ncbi:cupin [Lichenibacterium minor]|uniref:Cupin n=1 Tax=Lichenibacterium minor TaxID=2316528 RepID=A0A4Q2U950_9HYPH|nr:cupin [Lichenibacterium minor]RYC31627.1 cupin [Lichenibacterium minor]